MITSVALASALLVSATMVVSRPGEPMPLRLMDVRITPPSPLPEQTFAVSVRAQGGSLVEPLRVNLFFASSYRNELASTVLMRGQGPEEYATVIGPFADGAEVWLLLALTTERQGPVYSNHRFVAIGTVDRDPSLLRVENATHSPSGPRPSSPVTVTAEVRSNEFVTKVFLTYAWFSRETVGANNRFMGTPDGIAYFAPLDDTGRGLRFPVGTLFVYRVAAIDVNGVVADSGVRTFVIV